MKRKTESKKVKRIRKRIPKLITSACAVGWVAPQLPKPIYEEDGIVLYNADCTRVLPLLEPNSVDAIITDPPYSSGGQFRSDRTRATNEKYIQTDSVDTFRTPFTGDNRDQRGFLIWCMIWMGQARMIAKEGALIECFTDWRQLPTISDALQCGGWVWRGIATWWKPGIRMQRGRFSLSAEYVLYGSNGTMMDGERSPQNVFSFAPVAGEDKNHIAEKPREVMDWIMGATTKDGTILDPFCGSGTTLVAAKRLGRKAIGVEISEKYCRTTIERLRQRELF